MSIRSASLIFTAALIALPASAEPLSDEDRRFWISAGALIADIDTDVALSREGETTTGSDLESRFGLDSDKTELRLEAQAHINTRHRIFASWMGFNRTTTGSLSSDFEYGDVTYDAASDFELKTSVDFLAIGYRWDAVDRENFELGVSIAPVFVDLEAEVVGTGTVSDGMTTMPFAGSRQAGVNAPVPLVGLHLDWNKDERFWARTSLQYISADLGDFDGSMFEGEIRFDWFPTEVFGIGLGYSYVQVELDDFEQREFDGSFDHTYSSLFGYLSFRF
jgi:hypothetical protein